MIHRRIIGGLGEIEFIKNTQFLDGLFVLYHGITNMLRIGDFSTYGLGVGIVGVGELKTRKNDEKIIVTANITSKLKIDNPLKNKGFLGLVRNDRKHLKNL